MDWSLIVSFTAVAGVIINFIRFGHWQGSIESRVDALEHSSGHHDAKLDELVGLINKQNELLTELKVRLEIVLEKGKKK